MSARTSYELPVPVSEFRVHITGELFYCKQRNRFKWSVLCYDLTTLVRALQPTATAREDCPSVDKWLHFVVTLVNTKVKPFKS
jgi:hypothetical protein